MNSALYNLEGDFGFSPANASAPAPEVGHEVKLINFAGASGQPAALNFQRFAHNKTLEEAFSDGIRGFNRPTNVRVGPDGCAYIADYGAVRDFGRSDPDAGFQNGADAVLVQIPNWVGGALPLSPAFGTPIGNIPVWPDKPDHGTHTPRLSVCLQTWTGQGNAGYDDLAMPRSKSALRFSAMTRPSTPSRRRTELNSERCTASWLIVPSR